MIEDFECLRVDGDAVHRAACPVIEEVPLSIFINGRHFTTAMISPQMRREFVAGHLYSERIVSQVQEIESLEVEGDVARVIVTNPIRAVVPRRPIVSGCGGIASFLDEARLPRIRSGLTIRMEQAREAMEAISLSKTHIATGGVHSVGLFDRSGPLTIVEDIGRHNALDKAIGIQILKGEEFDFGRMFAACTGRVSSDMALKCSVAGIPIVVSRGATTGLAISIAQRTGLGIIGFLRGKRLTVYSNPERFEIG
ncbi:MAG: formate dehydrogenase accessory sulfurtransferase FdhD [Methanothrix sp.]|jgi:FdhD protein|uniref:formate dehydrogenase accessory sulfurtransferase FdhD n=1 Tax=Methanothrix sp. TaxID=90426 RepID=UPI0032AF36A4